MKTYTIQIRRNSDGRIVEMPYESDDEHATIFQWEENNYACDCNRSLFFARVLGIPEDWERGCSENDFAVRILDGDREVYEDFSDPYP